MDASAPREKILGCWTGKAVGGALGMPYEGRPGTHNLTFYDPVPDGAVPNDDLDLQVLWACLLDRTPIISRQLFADGWRGHVAFPWDEYGVAIRNLRLGVPAPHSGLYDNWYVDGLGAAIRTELWACLAPGDPERAAAYAQTDAEVDHHGDGVHAARFLAALESAAFAEGDPARLAATGLAAIPADSRLAHALIDTRDWCAGRNADEWRSGRERIVERWGRDNFTDVAMNLCFIEMALLLGGLDFDRSLCMAVNCGADADCTGATVGAILGIIRPEGIPERWLAPVSRRLVVDARITGIAPPATLDDFTALVLRLRDKVTHAPEPAPAFDPLRFAVAADIATLPAWPLDAPERLPATLTMPPGVRPALFPGQLACVPASAAPVGGVFLARFRFILDREREVRVVFNTNAYSAVYLDGALAFHRDGGPMNPSAHRAPAGQFADRTLAAGEHELIAALAPRREAPTLEWVVTVADKATFQWLPVFHAPDA